MKKTYMNPVICVVTIHTTQMLAASPGVNDGDGLGKGYNSDDVSYGRGFDYYDDEEEFEDE